VADLSSLIDDEVTVLARVLPALVALQQADARTEADLARKSKVDHAAFTDSYGDRVQREALEQALEAGAMTLRSHLAARRSRELPLGTPYFGRLVLREPSRRAQEILLGKVGVTEGGLAICDWRHAPVSRLYYEYEEGEEYCEEIAGREREGEIAVKRRVDVREGQLVEVQAGATVLRRGADGTFAPPRQGRAEERDDHRLPDIVSLITREQFGVIARPDAGVVLLRGRAGSGKTTVALHRIAWLHFQDAARFRPDRILVVMFNKALQTYISRVLPDLGVAGVLVETFHGWAARMLRQGGIRLPFRATVPPPVARIKRHPAIGALLEDVVAALGEKTAAWLEPRLPEALRPAWEATPGVGLARLGVFQRAHRLDPALTARIRARLLDHARDLWGMFDDEERCRRALPTELHRALPAARAHQAACARDGALDWQDAALLLRLGQLKHDADPDLRCPWAGLYAHVVVDEAQDLSTVEIAALLGAADAGRSVTIAGDPAQKILSEAQFEGFEDLLQRLSQHVDVRLDALAVGHRSTRPIMALALRALGKQDDPILESARAGDPVTWIEGGESEVYDRVAAAVTAFREARPATLVAVLCKRKAVADAWAGHLATRGVVGVRRAARQDFQFHPGVVVSNVHQVKGLEFDAVVLVDPADYGGHDRRLLHVAITRAAERLWVAASDGRGVLA
jgi:DNA helicase-2/ATP-dependent DNA helicase PcrA